MNANISGAQWKIITIDGIVEKLIEILSSHYSWKRIGYELKFAYTLRSKKRGQGCIWQRIASIRRWWKKTWSILVVGNFSIFSWNHGNPQNCFARFDHLIHMYSSGGMMCCMKSSIAFLKYLFPIPSYVPTPICIFETFSLGLWFIYTCIALQYDFWSVYDWTHNDVITKIWRTSLFEYLCGQRWLI